MAQPSEMLRDRWAGDLECRSDSSSGLAPAAQQIKEVAPRAIGECIENRRFRICNRSATHYA
jgi:hypothetical protein